MEVDTWRTRTNDAREREEADAKTRVGENTCGMRSSLVEVDARAKGRLRVSSKT